MKTDAAAHAREEQERPRTRRSRQWKLQEGDAHDVAVSVFISRKTQHLYVRQSFQPVFESPVTIRDADHSIGTHIYTVLDYVNGGADLRWSAVSMDRSPDKSQLGQMASRDVVTVTMSSDVLDAGPAMAALDRMRFSRTRRRISNHLAWIFDDHFG